MKATPLNNATLVVISESAPWKATSASEDEKDKEKENEKVKPKARPRPRAATEEEGANKKESITEEIEKGKRRSRCRLF